MSRLTLYEKLAWPFIRRFTQPNRVHENIMKLAGLFEGHPSRLRTFERLALAGGEQQTFPRLSVKVGDIKLENPFILPAGFDKDAHAVETLSHLSFGALVIGSVLEHAQPGNPKPTIFRPADGVILNRMGFPSEGTDTVAMRLERYAHLTTPIGISLGLNKTTSHENAPGSYARVAERMSPYASFFEINVSSPNTPGLRQLQDKTHLIDIIQAVKDVTNDQAIFIKISPDLPLEAVDEVIEVVTDHQLAGIVATNTTANPDIKSALGPRWAKEAGGVSGPPLRELATLLVRHIYQQTNGAIDIIGSGGISDLDAVLEKLFAGATGLAIYTALISRGPSLPSTLCRQLDQWCEERGITQITEIIGHPIGQ